MSLELALNNRHGPLDSLDFELPPGLEAGEPPEARGMARDEVRLMVSYRDTDRVIHSTFRDLGDFLEAGDVLVINTSGTMNAALAAEREDGSTLDLPAPVNEYLDRYGFPIRYGYVRESWPLDYYQTVYATEAGSAEMPSAGRAFTPELITSLVARGVQVAPLILHTGVASPENHEPPYEEYYRVPAATARTVNTARSAGKRVIAVGTTSVRALETVTDEDGVAHPGEGWTRLIVTPERGVRSIDGMLTGLHEPRSSHLAMLEAVAGRDHLRTTYAEALGAGYLWHEFGDLHLILGC